MKKFKADGQRVKSLRNGRERNATQKEFAHEIRVSERQLRKIENENAPITSAVVDRIAAALKVHRQIVTLDDRAPDAQSASLVPMPPDPPALPVKREPRIIPRFDTTSARQICDEDDLFEIAAGNKEIVFHIKTGLTAETEEYASELFHILKSLTWDERPDLDPIAGEEVLQIRRRLRQLIVLLKGNDVWIYGCHNFKYVPETFEIVKSYTGFQLISQVVIALGAPGEYGETTIYVPIDNGRPILIDH
jgi:transcriptional regulator with XRE-family HTH domain